MRKQASERRARTRLRQAGLSHRDGDCWSVSLREDPKDRQGIPSISCHPDDLDDFGSPFDHLLGPVRKVRRHLPEGVPGNEHLGAPLFDRADRLRRRRVPLQVDVLRAKRGGALKNRDPFRVRRRAPAAFAGWTIGHDHREWPLREEALQVVGLLEEVEPQFGDVGLGGDAGQSRHRLGHRLCSEGDADHPAAGLPCGSHP